MIAEATYKHIEYDPSGAAYELMFNCRDPEVLLDGPANTGKSRAVGEYLLWVATEFPGARIAVVRSTRVDLTESFLVTWETKVLGGGLDKTYLDQPIEDGASRETRRSYYFKNGSVLVPLGMDKPTRLYSTEWDIIYVQEAIELSEDEWERLTRGLRNKVVPWQQLIGDTNPDAETHWLNRRCDRGQTTRLESRHADNPSLTEPELETLRRLTGVRRERLYLGKWVASEGQVWENFERQKHVLRNYPESLPRDEDGNIKWFMKVAAVDWGWRKAGCIQVWGVDREGRMYCYREVYRVQISVTIERNEGERRKENEESWLQWAKEIQLQENADTWQCDPAEPDFIQQFRRAGIPATEADNEVLPGLDAVRDRLANDHDGKPRIYFMANRLRERCPVCEAANWPCGVVEEIPQYIFPKAEDGKIIKEEPDKACQDHGCDTARYATRYVDRFFIRPRTKRKSYRKTAGFMLEHDEKEYQDANNS